MIDEENDLKGKKFSNQVINVSDCQNTQILVTNDKSISSFDDENSIVAFFLDTFNLKKFLETIINSQSYFKITHNFINIILLMLFLAFIFWQVNLLKFEKNSATITLMILGFCAIFELLGANTSIFKGFLDSDIKTKKFIEGIPFLSSYKIEKEVKRQNFSQYCLEYFIEKLKDVNAYSQNTVYIVLDSQYLGKRNLDALFSAEIINNISRKIILKILFRYRNNLTQENMENIYNAYSYDDDIVKMLIATQEYSDFLKKSYPEDLRLPEYYKKYQTGKKYLDWRLKLLPINKLPYIKKLSKLVVLLIFFLLLGQLLSTTPKLDEDFLLSLLALGVLFVQYVNESILDPAFKKMNDYYFKHLLGNITKTSKTN
ncbi:hypothetical protein SDC9_91729 [bioreactor metagenome]|uniref:Uncharacterized protein n=1 Tax=bioreactor metagenome TaxID=1076179 RepID=A0A645A5K4_9ZZZZ